MSIENYWKSRWRYYWRWSGPRVAYVDVRSLLPGMPEARTHLTAHCCFKCKWLSHGRLVTVSHTLSNISSLLLPKESSPSKPPTEGITFSLFPKLLWASDSPWPPFPLNFDTALASTLLCLYSVFSHSWPWPLCIGGGGFGLPQLQEAINHYQPSARLARQVLLYLRLYRLYSFY